MVSVEMSLPLTEARDTSGQKTVHSQPNKTLLPQRKKMKFTQNTLMLHKITSHSQINNTTCVVVVM